MQTEELQIVRNYSPEELKKSALVVYSRSSKYSMSFDEVKFLFDEGSNYHQLTHPIYDDEGNEFWDSEGYYMAARTKNKNIKSIISFLSLGFGMARKSRYMFPLDLDPKNKISYMREAIRKKFDANPDLRKKLLQTGDLSIIEYTYWGDDFFGVDQKTMRGANILGKLLMEYRDSCIE